ncbi:MULTISPECIES: ABC transporter ATP-binding protein [Ferrimonas]|uniref:ABC transporter ATP-binding protein n=1 Tax=Ferrimonas TaxID=44011 RepID=UPI00041DE7C3|nr:MULTISPECIES: ABC transporter ATP-binding protein [Ferrimonas]USD38949.1 ABC transporter ATP-binding protein [Ferrimonas sp. SCSIO 43195]
MLRFDELHKTYGHGQQRVHALRGVSGQIDASEMVALCGPSGSGKSTLLNLLGLLDRHDAGEIRFNDQTLPSDARAAALFRRQQMGFVFQRFNLVPVMTAEENVAYPLYLAGLSRAEQRRQARSMLTEVGLKSVLDHRPDHLSGGQQQRVAIARALVHQPALVIADEPTASLDSDNANLIIDIMKRLGHQRGTTFIIATHDSRMAGRCDRTLSLLDGQMHREARQWAS